MQADYFHWLREILTTANCFFYDLRSKNREDKFPHLLHKFTGRADDNGKRCSERSLLLSLLFVSVYFDVIWKLSLGDSRDIPLLTPNYEQNDKGWAYFKVMCRRCKRGSR